MFVCGENGAKYNPYPVFPQLLVHDAGFIGTP